MANGPTINRHRSVQEVGTPREFLDAVEHRFGRIGFDLAASPHNAVCLAYWTKQDDALSKDWMAEAQWPVRWLNPEFGNIPPWAAKLAGCRYLPRWTLMLVPASIGTNWYRDYIDGQMMVWGIPRMCFVGSQQAYPKDLMLCAAGYGVQGHGFWDWRKERSIANADLVIDKMFGIAADEEQP